MDGKIIATSFEIISHSGEAKANYLKAIEFCKEKKNAEAQKLMKEGDEEYLIAHKAHGELLQSFAANDDIEVNILLVHALDHLSTAQVIGLLSREIIALRSELSGREE